MKRRRDPNRGRFKPGQSGNPGGRPKELTEMRLAARAHTVEALNTLVIIMRSRKSAASARVRAVSELLDRAWGKPVQELQVQGAMAHIDVKAGTPRNWKETGRRMAFLLAAGAHGEERAR